MTPSQLPNKRMGQGETSSFPRISRSISPWTTKSLLRLPRHHITIATRWKLPLNDVTKSLHGEKLVVSQKSADSALLHEQIHVHPVFGFDSLHDVHLEKHARADTVVNVLQGMDPVCVAAKMPRKFFETAWQLETLGAWCVCVGGNITGCALYRDWVGLHRTQ